MSGSFRTGHQVQEPEAPSVLAESIDILGESGILDAKFAYDFGKIAGFRNFLAHEYEHIDPSFICEKILPKLEDVDRFLDVIAEKCG